MKKLSLIFLVVAFCRTVFSSTDNGVCLSRVDLGNVELTSPGMKKVCGRTYDWGWKYRWDDEGDAWCEHQGVTFDANKHTASKNDAQRCWMINCASGVKKFENMTECVQCNGANQKIQNGICYEVDCDLTAGNVIYANPNKPNEPPRCLPVCDVQTVAASFDMSDSTKLVFKIRKQNAKTMGERVDGDGADTAGDGGKKGGTDSSESAIFNIPYSGKIFKSKSVTVNAGQGYNLSDFLKPGHGVTVADFDLSTCGNTFQFEYVEGGKVSHFVHNKPNLVTASDGKEAFMGGNISLDRPNNIISWAKNAGEICNKHNFLIVTGAYGSPKDKLIFYIK